MFGRGATILTPLVVVALFKAYGVGGVLSLMIALLVMQIVVVWAWGIEPAKRGLEALTASTADITPRTMRA
jgi:putative MFS transporter